MSTGAIHFVSDQVGPEKTSEQKEKQATEIYASLNLLAHAQILNLDIGSECGGHGRCGKDLVCFSKDDQNYLSPCTEHERKHLSPAQIKEGWRLACQCYPNDESRNITAKTAVEIKPLA